MRIRRRRHYDGTSTYIHYYVCTILKYKDDPIQHPFLKTVQSKKKIFGYRFAILSNNFKLTVDVELSHVMVCLCTSQAHSLMTSLLREYASRDDHVITSGKQSGFVPGINPEYRNPSIRIRTGRDTRICACWPKKQGGHPHQNTSYSFVIRWTNVRISCLMVDAFRRMLVRGKYCRGL